jgi:predicted DNA-binding WGR domain protein
LITAVHLRRIDDARNMRRFYRLDVQPDLFGAWCVFREWGRIGRAGQVREAPYPTPAEAHAALDKQRRRKERKGYARPSKLGQNP